MDSPRSTSSDGHQPWTGAVCEVSAVAECDVESWSDIQVRAGLLELLSAVNSLESVVASLVEVADRRGLPDRDGFRGIKTWLAGFGRLSPYRAGELLTAGKLLRRLPKLSEVARDGQTGLDQVGKVADLAKHVGVDKIIEFDEVLAGLAAGGDPSDVAQACQRIQDHLDPDGPEPDPEAHQRRCLTLSRTGSLVHISGKLDLEGGSTLQTALDALMKPPTRDDVLAGVTATMRRADALIELGRRALLSGQVGTTEGERPQVGILISPDIITRLGCSDPQCTETGPAADGRERCRALRAQLPPDLLTSAGVSAAKDQPWGAWVGTISDAVAARLACDCQTWRTVLDPRSGLPLELGRSVRIVPAWLRKAIAARDRGCRWPGCEAPAQWCDAHHLRHWLVGGPTDVDNILLLCRHHHMRVHEDKWHIELDPATGELWAWRPDGTPYELAPSTPWTSPNHRPTPACHTRHRKRRRVRGPTPWDPPTTNAA